MTITDAKRELVEGWHVQACLYDELDTADKLDAIYDLRSRIEGEPVSAPPLTFKSRRVK